MIYHDILIWYIMIYYGIFNDINDEWWFFDDSLWWSNWSMMNSLWLQTQRTSEPQKPSHRHLFLRTQCDHWLRATPVSRCLFPPQEIQGARGNMLGCIDLHQWVTAIPLENQMTLHLTPILFKLILWMFQADRLNSLQMRKKNWTAAKFWPFQVARWFSGQSH